MGVRHRVHGKMHKSVDVALLQERLGGSVGVCCQKVSEAEVFARGGIKDVLVSNQVRDPAKIDRLARLPKLGARTIVCVDDLANVADLSAAAVKHGTTIECLVEIDCGAGRCGVKTTPEVVAIAKAIDAAPGLKFSGHPGLSGRDAAHGQVRGPQGQDRHRRGAGEGRGRRAEGRWGWTATSSAAAARAAIISKAHSGVYNELQCGSYAFMDADYGRILDKDGKRIDQGEWENALFILTCVMSHAKADKAICDAGLKAQSVDSGLPVIFGRTDVKYVKCSRRAWRDRGPAGCAEGQRQAEAGAGPLRPDLQRA